jgi:hypothetical protein
MKKNLAASFLFFVSLAVFAHEDHYRYFRELKGINSEWHSMVLPDSIFGKINADLSDIRILGIDGGDTVEAPYILAVKKGSTDLKQIPFKIINRSKNEKGYFYTFDTEAKNPIDKISLDFSEKNFDWKINLEGSNDQREWFTLSEDYRIVSIHNPNTDYHFTDLLFPLAQYRYFRLSVKSKSEPGLLSAKIFRSEKTPGEVRSYTVRALEREENKKNKETVITITLSIPVPVSSVELKYNSSFDFYRPIRITYLSDSIKTPKGWKHTYASLASGTFSSFEKNEFIFPNTLVQKLKITVSNLDNEPVAIGDIIVKGNVHALTARFTKKIPYRLYYGNSHAQFPSYDIEKFSDKIPQDITGLSLGPEEMIAFSEAGKIKPLFENKAWLWGILVVVILLLGYASLGMMRKR